MYNADTELLFPLRVVSSLRGMRGEEWNRLVDHIESTDCTKSEQYAFVLMMVRLNGCIACDADSFRAMRGCTQCARQIIKRYKGPDAELLAQYRQAQAEMQNFLSTRGDGLKPG